MIISPKKLGIFPFFISTLGIIQPHLKSFSDLSKPIGRIKPSHAKYDQTIFAFTQQSNSNFLQF